MAPQLMVGKASRVVMSARWEPCTIAMETMFNLGLDGRKTRGEKDRAEDHGIRIADNSDNFGGRLERNAGAGIGWEPGGP